MSGEDSPDAELSTANVRANVSSMRANSDGCPTEPEEAARSKLGLSSGSASGMAGPGEDDPRVIAALESYLSALRGGRSLSREEFLAGHPEIAAALGECLSGLELIQTGGFGFANPPPLEGEGESLPPSVRLGDYEIIREIGRGGMGMVYEARQISLGRRVALKVLPFASAADPTRRQRFQIEAQAAAQLHHPHIVPVFGVGCDNGLHYYAMQYIEGRSLSALLKPLWRVDAKVVRASPSERDQSDVKTELDLGGGLSDTIDGWVGVRDQDGYSKELPLAPQRTNAGAELPPEPYGGPLSASPDTAGGPGMRDRAFFRDAARLGAEAARALDHAHSLGILHRDIKPANLLIDRHGALWITDFGLARCAGEASLTQTGDLIGTLRYMSPEQSLARRGVVDQRTDIYALGATLYELLALRPAFDGDDHQELLRQIALDEPTPPRRIDAAVPRDLETIVLKAMAKEPSSRYLTAGEMSDDLTRFLEDRPIKARPPRMIERTMRWGKRRRELVATAAVVLLLAIVVLSCVTYLFARNTAAEARKAELLRLELSDQIHATFDIADSIIMQSIKASVARETRIGDLTATEFSGRIQGQATLYYERVSQLPTTDRKSRTIVARAFSRLGFLRGTISQAKRGDAEAQRPILAEAHENFRRSIELFEGLVDELPADRSLRRLFADALGASGWGGLFRTTGHAEKAEPLYRRAIDVWRGLILDGRTTRDIAGLDLDRSSLANAVSKLAELLDETGRAKEASQLRLQFAEDLGMRTGTAPDGPA